MNNMTFNDYCDDIINQSTGLMTEKQLEEARVGYKAWMAPRPAATAAAKHPDAKYAVSTLVKKVKVFIENQRRAAANSSGYDVTLSLNFVAKATEALAGKPEKSELIDLIVMNSDASRALNAQKLARERAEKAA